jgi:hypothetical protein
MGNHTSGLVRHDVFVASRDNAGLTEVARHYTVVSPYISFVSHLYSYGFIRWELGVAIPGIQFSQSLPTPGL